LAKDLRELLGNQKEAAWYLDPKTYTIKQAAERVREYFYTELYRTEFQSASGMALPLLDFFVAGFSAGTRSSEIWQIVINGDGTCGDPQQVVSASDPSGIRWDGQIEAC